MDIYQRLQELNIQLPEAPPLGGIYSPVRQSGNLLFVSGHGCTLKGKPVWAGKLGAQRTLEEGQEAARLCTLNALASLHAFLGDLNKIKQFVKTFALVASAPGFNSQPKVVNGASQLLIDIFGKEKALASRSAMGTNELPDDISVEIEFIVEI